MIACCLLMLWIKILVYNFVISNLTKKSLNTQINCNKQCYLASLCASTASLTHTHTHTHWGGTRRDPRWMTDSETMQDQYICLNWKQRIHGFQTKTASQAEKWGTNVMPLDFACAHVKRSSTSQATNSCWLMPISHFTQLCGVSL